MSVHADLTKLDQEAARIALLVLRANVRCVTPPHGYVIPPEQRPVPPMQAESALARLVKPVHCNARMEGELLALDCQLLEGPSRDNFRARATGHAHSWESSLRRVCQEPIDTATLLLRTSTESVTASFRALRQWFEDYHMRYSLSWVGPRLVPPPGVCIVLDVDPPSDISIEMVHVEE